MQPPANAGVHPTDAGASMTIDLSLLKNRICANSNFFADPLEPVIDALGLAATGLLGTVTSVSMTVPSEFSISGSPVTAAGTLAVTWNAPVTPAHGGTGANLSATGGTSQVLKQTSVGGNVTVARLAAADLSDFTTWATSTPTPTPDSGTFTTATATQNVLVIGKLAHVVGSCTITTNGTAAGGVSVPMPTSVTWAGSVVAYGREAGLTGKMLIGSASGGNMRFTNYDGTYPGGSGAVLIFEYFGAIA